MERKSNKTAYTFLSIAVLAIVVLAGGWYFLKSQSTVVKIESDQPAYFTVDHPTVEVKILNPKDATSGEIGVKFEQNILKLTDTQTSEGVTLRTLENEYVFELSEEYFASKNNTVATLKFENAQRGIMDFEINKELTSLSNPKGKMEISFEDLSIEVGVAPDRAEDRKPQGNTGEFNSL